MEKGLTQEEAFETGKTVGRSMGNLLLLSAGIAIFTGIAWYNADSRLRKLEGRAPLFSFGGNKIDKTNSTPSTGN